MKDEEWKRLEDYFPKYEGYCRPRKYSYRSIVNGIRYIERTGCQWRYLPSDYPPWDLVYHYHRKWREEDKWEAIMKDFREELRKKAGKNAEPSVAIIDSRSVKTAQKGGNVDMMQVSVLKAGSNT
jgi:transposase